MKRPRISVAMCTYNGEQYLARQLASILGQTRSPYELVISDDHSTDGSLALLERVCEDASFPVRVIRNTENLGVKANFEKAISACTGDYIALADQDDVWCEDKVSIFAKAILDSDRSVPTLFYTDLTLIDSQGEVLGDSFLSRAKIEAPTVDCWKFLATRNFAPGCCTVFDVRLIEQILPLPAQCIIHDWWINLLFSLSGSICRLDSQTMYYRLHAGNNQGIGNYRKTLEAGADNGFIEVASGNIIASINQLKTAVVRLRENDLPYPEPLDQLFELFECPAVMRPILLARLGITRGNAVKTLQMLVASVFVTTDQVKNDNIRYV